MDGLVRAGVRTGVIGVLLAVVAIPIARATLGSPDSTSRARRSEAGAAAVATTATTSALRPPTVISPSTTTTTPSTTTIATTTTVPRRATTTTTPATTAAAGAATAGPVVAASTPRPARPGMATLGRIRISRIGLDQPLYEGITQNVIDAGPAHWPGTALPGQTGNMVIAGHRTSYTRPFYAAAELRAGDSIIVDTNDGRRYTYRVDELFIVPKNALWIKNPLPGRRLTIFTCNPIGSSRERLVVRATLAG